MNTKIYILVFIMTSALASQFRSSNLKNPIPIVFDSVARSAGSTETLEIELNKNLPRVRKFTIHDASIQRTYKALNEGNIILSVDGTRIGEPDQNVALHITPNLYTIDSMVDAIQTTLSHYHISAVFRYDDILNKFYFEINPSGEYFQIFERDLFTPFVPFQDQLDYTVIGTANPVLGINVGLNFININSGRYYAATSVTWDNLRVKDRNNRIPIVRNSAVNVKIANGIYQVHDLANMLQIGMNGAGIGTWIVKFSTVRNTFFIKTDRLITLSSAPNNDNELLGFDTNVLSLKQHSLEGEPIDVINALINFNNLSVTIRVKGETMLVTVPDLVNNTINEAAFALQEQLDNNFPDTFTVSIVSQNVNFEIRTENNFTILSSSVNFDLVYGFLIKNLPITYQFGVVSWYPSFELNTVSLNTLSTFVTTETGLITPGTYNYEGFRVELEDNLNANYVGGVPWVITINESCLRYTITNPTVGTYFTTLSVESTYWQIGISLRNLVDPDIPYSSTNAIIMDPNTYIYVKSHVMTRNKEDNIFVSDRYEDVIGRILIDKEYGETITSYFDGHNQIIFPLNINYLNIDLRLEFEDNSLVYLEGSNWSITMIYITF